MLNEKELFHWCSRLKRIVHIYTYSGVEKCNKCLLASTMGNQPGGLESGVVSFSPQAQGGNILPKIVTRYSFTFYNFFFFFL